jgi:hypothetical protein
MSPDQQRRSIIEQANDEARRLKRNAATVIIQGPVLIVMVAVSPAATFVLPFNAFEAVRRHEH